jgi:hypothetical protein
MLRGYGAAYTVMQRCRDAIMVELEQRNQKPARVGIVPGAIAWDECDQCGLLALSSTRNYLTDEFPIEVATTFQKQGAFLGIDLAIQLIRCAPTPQGTATAPSEQALDETAKLINDDAWSVMCATTTVLQTMLDANELIDYMVRQQIFMGPEGACVGSELQAAIAVAR